MNQEQAIHNYTANAEPSPVSEIISEKFANAQADAETECTDEVDTK